jgi:hypothetical protein
MMQTRRFTSARNLASQGAAFPNILGGSRRARQSRTNCAHRAYRIAVLEVRVLTERKKGR